MKLLALLAFVALSLKSTHGVSSADEQDVRCYVCQWTSKSGYTSPWVDGCLDDDIAKNHKAFIQTCGGGKGCYKKYTYQGTGMELINVQRFCTTVTNNKIITSRVCRGSNCNAGDSTAGTAVGTTASCHTGSVSTAATTTTVPTSISCGADTAATRQYCVRVKTAQDIVTDGPLSSINAFSYSYSCYPVPTTFWTATEYTSVETHCVNSFCNSGSLLKASMITMATMLLAKLFL